MIDKGLRTGTFKAFAEKYVGDKISLLTFAHVNKIIMKDKTAVGVEVSRFGQIDQFYADQEVILSAGTIGSPQILMLSGIGDTEHLQEVGVEPVHHLPEVGHNLQDHLIVPVNFDTPEPLSLDVLASLYPATLLNYLRDGSGPLSSTGGLSGAAHVVTSINNDTRHRPDLQLHLCALTIAIDHGLVLKKNFGVSDLSWSWASGHVHNYSSMILPTINRPRSRGFIKLRSNNPHDHPVIQPNYLTLQEDVDTLVAGIKVALDLLNTQVRS